MEGRTKLTSHLLLASICILYLYLIVFAPSYDVLPWVMQRFDDKRILQISIIIITLFTALLNPAQFKLNKITPNTAIMLAICVIAALGIISSLLSASPRHAFMELSLFGGLCFFSLAVRHTWFTYKTRMIEAIYLAVLLSATIYMIGFFTGYIASYIEEIPLTWPEPFYGFSSVRFLNQYQIWTLPLLSLPILLKENIRRAFKNTWLLVASGWWVLFFASNSRGVMLSMVIAYIATAFFYKRQSVPFLRTQFITLVCGLATYVVLFHAIPSLASIETATGTIIRSSTSDRLELWRSAVTMVADNPWLGVGPMHFAWFPNPESFSHPHSSLLQFAAEWGIPSTLILISLLIIGLQKWTTRFNASTLASASEENKHIPVVLFCSFTAGISYSLVSGVIVMPMSQIMMATIIGLMLAIYNEESISMTNTGKINAKYVLQRMVAGLLLGIYIWAVLPDLIPRILGQDEYLSYKTVTVGPRFWQHGGIPY